MLSKFYQSKTKPSRFQLHKSKKGRRNAGYIYDAKIAENEKFSQLHVCACRCIFGINCQSLNPVGTAVKTVNNLSVYTKAKQGERIIKTTVQSLINRVIHLTMRHVDTKY